MMMPSRGDLSEEQRDIFLKAPLNGAVLVTGPPGTGKTVIAIYRAKLLRQSAYNFNIVMYNKVLANYTRMALEDADVLGNAKSWHSWVYGWWRKGGAGNIPEVKSFNPDFTKALQLILTGKVRSIDMLDWNHIIIDEGQDFPKEFYLLTRLVMDKLAGKSSNTPAISVFADENQRLDEYRNASIEEIKSNLRPDNEYLLTENFRNTYEIAKLAASFYVGLSTGIPQLPKGHHGRKPIIRQFATIDDEARYIARYSKNNDDQNVGVIVPGIDVLRKLLISLDKPTRGSGIKVQAYIAGDRTYGDATKLDFTSGGTIMLITYNSCKGLEFDAVFIPQIQRYQFDGAEDDFFKMRMYVMCSRAKTHLVISYSDCDSDPGILTLFPNKGSEIMEWQI